MYGTRDPAVPDGRARFCAYAAPVVLSGQATFAGYIKLDDTATFLALTDRVMEHGLSLSGLAPSSYEATLSVNLGHGYPVGALLPVGIGRALVGVDGACTLAALVGVLSVLGAVWLLAPAAAALVLVTRGRMRAAQIGVLAGTFALLALPTLMDARSFLSVGTTELRSGTVLGNLVQPLNKLQVLGVWPTGDFRFAPADLAVRYILIATVAAAALVGAVLAWRGRGWAFLLYVASAGVGCALVAALASPWIVAKAYAIASPAFVLAATVGCGGLVARRRVTEGTVALVAVAGGVLWSNALAYHDVNLAPRQQLVELEQIGHRFAGDGPALMTEYQPYGVRHFLRALDAEGASELRRRLIPLRNGTVLAKGAYADLAGFQPSAVRVYRTLVLRRSPLASRPPTPYRLVWRGQFYDVWQRAPTLAAVAYTRLPCRATRTLSGRTSWRPAGERVVVLGLGRVDHPSAWQVGAGGQVLYPSDPGVIRTRIRSARTGRYSLWVGGSFRNRLSALIDSRTIGNED
jgi:hypothetical protein